jgi:hypothetical protein
MGKHQETLVRIEMIKESQAVQKDQCLTAAGHTIDDVKTKIIGQGLAVIG